MKKRILWSMVLILVIAIAYTAGGWIEGFRHGYHYNVLEEKEIESALGPVRWKSVVEYVGFPVLDTQSTLLEVDGRTVYKARRIFQEDFPWASNVRVNDGLIEWEDGEYSFSLRMQKVTPRTHVATAPIGVPSTEQVSGTRRNSQ